MRFLCLLMSKSWVWILMILFDLPDRRKLFLVKKKLTLMCYTVCHPWVVLGTKKDYCAICWSKSRSFISDCTSVHSYFECTLLKLCTLTILKYAPSVWASRFYKGSAIQLVERYTVNIQKNVLEWTKRTIDNWINIKVPEKLKADKVEICPSHLVKNGKVSGKALVQYENH